MFVRRIPLVGYRQGCQVIYNLKRNLMKGERDNRLIPSLVYSQLARSRGLNYDCFQQKVLEDFDKLHLELENHVRRSWLSKKFITHNIPRGIYLYGPVGCGKTFLMDVFVQSCNENKTWRTHFHEFMRFIHEQIFIARTSAPRDGRPFDPIPSVSKLVMKQCELLCFDEFQVTDIADAMILKRLFEHLFDAGAVVVATSNRHPDDLYKNGLQRVNFVPFIAILKKKCHVINLESGVDYRYKATADAVEKIDQVFFIYGTDTDVDHKLEAWFYRLASECGHSGSPEPAVVTTYGRSVSYRRTLGGVVLCSFEELCDMPMSAADYLSFASRFHTVVMCRVPELGTHRLASLKRFTHLVDVLYDNHVRLILGSDRPIDQLLTTGGNQNHSREPTTYNREMMDNLGLKEATHRDMTVSVFTSDEDLFAFKRTISRLNEMSSPTYWHSSGSAR